ncbi:carbohydrate ABC transporter permease [Clostridium sp. NSJ-49]|uniref:Carbohydrate uptake ABC transporter permease n=1 Tax=Clostridium disporicum TaxID=84024 RepID=A0A173XX27_9CLOT|nr:MULTISPECIES: carbohydrate ABC transporter permease [Clostridium]MBC5625611.1 carbohydrate ABC transporter permease [Clostridium sp. NSJ-49]MCD2501035.1 carbohydrate ABC transporter permease [Clostridium sp. NSJ-145]CUN56491.1 carbohydrate uptake ABC transporter permease [Clostridium disporicum]
MKNKLNIKVALKYFILVAFAIITLFPFYWMIASSFKDSFEVIQTPPTMVPNKILWENYSTALSMAPFGRYFINTIIVTILSIISTVIIAILSAFAFSHLEFKGRDLIFSIFLASMMIPGEVLIVTNFKTISQLGLMDTYTALFVPYMANVLYIYMLREFFLKIPKQLYYAAKVDGSSDWKFLWRIVVPMAKPSIITICILVGINSWNAFLWPLLVTNKENMRLLATGLTAFQSDAGNQYELIMAASTIITMPIIAVYIFLHKKIMSGISIGGIKG